MHRVTVPASITLTAGPSTSSSSSPTASSSTVAVRSPSNAAHTMQTTSISTSSTVSSIVSTSTSAPSKSLSNGAIGGIVAGIVIVLIVAIVSILIYKLKTHPYKLAKSAGNLQQGDTETTLVPFHQESPAAPEDLVDRVVLGGRLADNIR